MILKVHLQGAASYEVADEIWEESLTDAIRAEAETIAGYAGSGLLESPDQPHRDALRDRIVDEMTSALVSIGDRYRAADDRCERPLRDIPSRSVAGAQEPIATTGLAVRHPNGPPSPGITRQQNLEGGTQ